MTRHTLLSKPLIGMALLALLWGMLAPSFAHLAPHSSTPSRVLVELCTHAGVGAIEIDVPSSDHSSHSDEHQGQHCPFCRHAHADLAIVPPALSLTQPSAERIAYPPLFYQAPARLHAWTAALARAPPQRT
ncbi:DUF2946 domain-containing protein [Achromobacter sp. KS-M25]|nr:DUF2946 domain-containing protein [Achromobacter aestuarii]